MDAGDKTDSTTGEGYYALAVKGKAGAFGYFAGVNNGLGGDVSGNKELNIKAGVSMKMGAVKTTVMVMTLMPILLKLLQLHLLQTWA